jgi:hypothetical protein
MQVNALAPDLFVVGAVEVPHLATGQHPIQAAHRPCSDVLVGVVIEIAMQETWISCIALEDEGLLLPPFANPAYVSKVLDCNIIFLSMS